MGFDVLDGVRPGDNHLWQGRVISPAREVAPGCPPATVVFHRRLKVAWVPAPGAMLHEAIDPVSLRRGTCDDKSSARGVMAECGEIWSRCCRNGPSCGRIRSVWDRFCAGGALSPGACSVERTSRPATCRRPKARRSEGYSGAVGQIVGFRTAQARPFRRAEGDNEAGCLE